MRFVGHLTASRLHAPEGAPGGRAPLLSVPAVCDTARRLRTRCCCMIQVQPLWPGPALPAPQQPASNNSRATRRGRGRVLSAPLERGSYPRRGHDIVFFQIAAARSLNRPCAALTPLLIPSSQESQAEQSATLHPTIPPRTVLVSRHAPPPASQPSPAAASQQQPKAAASGEQLEGNKTRSWTGSVGSFGAGIVSTSRTQRRLFLIAAARPSSLHSASNVALTRTLSPLLWPGVFLLAARHGADKVGHVEDGIVFFSVPR